jgi:hypothetical protein
MTPTTPAPLRLTALTLLAVCLGLATALLLPFLFLVWYDAWWRRHEVEAHLSAVMPSPAEAGFTLFGYPVVYVQDEPDLEKPALDEAPLPPAFQRWMDGRKTE